MIDLIKMDVVGRESLRRRIAEAVIAVQDDYRPRYKMDDILSEIIVALLSLAGFVSKNNAGLSAYDFEAVCQMVREMEFEEAS